jgi:hypothetical protein
MNSDRDGYLLPNLRVHFYQKGTKSVYSAHPHKLTFAAICEDDFPEIQELRKAVCKHLGRSFGYCTVIMYSRDSDGMGYHNDTSQNTGATLDPDSEGEECIATLSLLGNRWFKVWDTRTQEIVTIDHSEHTLYVMNGIQAFSRHQKMKNLHGDKDQCQITIVFRQLNLHPPVTTPIRHRTVPVVWDKRTPVPDFSQVSPLPPFQGMDENEPSGKIWNSKAQMFNYGVHGSMYAGVHSVKNIIYSIICNDHPYNKISDSGNLIYAGSESNSHQFCKYNKRFAITGVYGIRFRLYNGPNSIFHPPKQGYQFYNLVFIVKFYPFTIIHKNASISFWWRFELSLSPPSECEIADMKSLYIKFAK